MIHLSDISWEDSEEAIKDYKSDQKIKFKILDIDVEKERISLGIKQLQKDKSKTDKLIGKIVTGVVDSIDKDKIFVSFDENKKGLIKKSNLAKLKSEQNTEKICC